MRLPPMIRYRRMQLSRRTRTLAHSITRWKCRFLSRNPVLVPAVSSLAQPHLRLQGVLSFSFSVVLTPMVATTVAAFQQRRRIMKNMASRVDRNTMIPSTRPSTLPKLQLLHPCRFPQRLHPQFLPRFPPGRSPPLPSRPSPAIIPCPRPHCFVSRDTFGTIVTLITRGAATRT